MHKLRTIALAVVALGVTVHPALSHTASIREQIEAAVKQGDQSMARKDIAGYMSLLADDFQGRDITGDTYNKEQARQNCIKTASFSRSMQNQTTVEAVTPTPGGAVVLSREHSVLSIVGRRTHKIHTLIFDGQWRSVWARTGQGWRLRREAQLSQTITEDGKARIVKPPSARPA